MTPETSLSRREILSRCTYGVGMLGLSSVLQAESFGATASSNPVAPRASHFPPRAKRIIHLWMNGGPSQVDSFDPKPALKKYEGQRPESTAKLSTERKTYGLMPSPFKFTASGNSGLPISEIFPHLAKCADDLCVIRSMHTNVPVHETCNFLMFTGNVQPIRPAYGS